jgi:hypothetical protein
MRVLDIHLLSRGALRKAVRRCEVSSNRRAQRASLGAAWSLKECSRGFLFCGLRRCVGAIAAGQDQLRINGEMVDAKLSVGGHLSRYLREVGVTKPLSSLVAHVLGWSAKFPQGRDLDAREFV